MATGVLSTGGIKCIRETCSSIPVERARTGIDQGKEEKKGNYMKGGIGGRG
jgi:hypothetical protein